VLGGIAAVLYLAVTVGGIAAHSCVAGTTATTITLIEIAQVPSRS